MTTVAAPSGLTSASAIMGFAAWKRGSGVCGADAPRECDRVQAGSIDQREEAQSHQCDAGEDGEPAAERAAGASDGCAQRDHDRKRAEPEHGHRSAAAPWAG